MTESEVAAVAEAGRTWIGNKRFGSAPPEPAMQEWFGTIASLSYQVSRSLKLVRLDGSVALAPGRAVDRYLRLDLLLGLLAMLSDNGYGWTDALEEFTDPLWRQDRNPDPVTTWAKYEPFGKASAELAETLDCLVEAFRRLRDWEYVGKLLRQTFIQVCRELILVESELARLGDIETPA